MASKFTVSNRTGWLMAGPAVLLIAGFVLGVIGGALRWQRVHAVALQRSQGKCHAPDCGVSSSPSASGYARRSPEGIAGRLGSGPALGPPPEFGSADHVLAPVFRLSNCSFMRSEKLSLV